MRGQDHGIVAIRHKGDDGDGDGYGDDDDDEGLD